MDLKNLKDNYEKFSKKYKMPSFEEINADFELDKIEKESGNFLRSVRKVVMEKIVNSMSFLDMLLNPMNAPRMYAFYISNMSVEDKERISRIYKEFADLTLDSLKLEISSDEKSESELIKRVFKCWNSVRKDFSLIVDNIKNPKVSGSRKERNYFG